MKAAKHRNFRRFASLLILPYASSLLILPYAFWPCAAAFAQCSGVQAPPETTNANPSQSLYVAPGQHFHLNVAALSDGFSTSEASDIINGLQTWAAVNGISFDYVSAAPGPGVITVQAGTGLGSDGFGQPNYGGTGYSPNQITGGTISFDLGYVSTCAAGPCLAYDASAPNADSYLTGLSSHEMGHILGLNDTPDAGQTNQTSTSVMGGQIGTNNNGDGVTPPAPTGNSPTDCDKQTVTSQGTSNTSSGGGGSGPGSCQAPSSPPPCMQWNGATCGWAPICMGGNCCGTSPILIDTDHSGFNLTSTKAGVQFDFFGTGKPIQIAWTAPGSTNGWLALDRNGNGKIDGAQELFGNITPQPPCATPNGYLALAVYDSNGDGVIDDKDPIWPKLLVWIDKNHDGISQPAELFTLNQLGIHAIDLKYSESWYIDEFGNIFRYRGHLVPLPGDHVDRVTFDVFLNSN